MKTPRGLGKGLSSMITPEAAIPNEKVVLDLPLSLVEPNQNQPRKHFDPEKLASLTDSVGEIGVILPIIVIKIKDRYQIVAGERRWRAAKAAGLKTIPAIVKDLASKEATEVALIENLQREDLNPIEEAKGYKSLIDGFSMTQEEISKRVGKNRSTITNALRILNLPDEIIKYIITGELSQGHARALLSLPKDQDRIQMALRIMKEGLSVRQVEKLVRDFVSPKKGEKKKDSSLLVEMKALENELARFLKTKVMIRHGAKKGKIEIEYYGNDDLDRILNFLKK